MLENAGLHADTSHTRGFTCLAQCVCGCVRVLEHISVYRLIAGRFFALGEPFINRKKTDKWAEGVSVARGPGRNQPTSNGESSLGRGIRADQFGGHTFFV